jgi:hypothetical protein
VLRLAAPVNAFAHGVTQPSAHGAQAHSAHDQVAHLPPYLALAYIMRTS